jgi:hypothetical protein
MTQKKYNITVWTLCIFAIILPITVWGQGINWGLTSITLYQWFSLFGILAWMVMWTHYVNGAIRLKYPDLSKPKYYSSFTGYLVLGSLLFHPGLLAYAQFINDQGLPPKSFYDYVGSSLTLAVILGSIALMIFLSFEIFDRLQDKMYIKKWWIYISLSQSLAMTLIFVHGLRLGSNFNSEWFLLIWWICGLILIPCFYIIHLNDLNTKKLLNKM